MKKSRLRILVEKVIKEGNEQLQIDKIAQLTGTNPKAVKDFCDRNQIEYIDLMQAIGSKRINGQDFVSALLNPRNEKSFVKSFDKNAIWKANPK